MYKSLERIPASRCLVWFYQESGLVSDFENRFRKGALLPLLWKPWRESAIISADDALLAVAFTSGFWFFLAFVTRSRVLDKIKTTFGVEFLGRER